MKTALESQRAGLFHGHLNLTRVPMLLINTIGADLRFFWAQRSFLAIFCPTNVTSTTPTMAGSLQLAVKTLPNPTKPHQHPHECLRYRRRCRRRQFGRRSGHHHRRGWAQVSRRRLEGTFHLRTEGKNHQRPHNNTQWHNNQSGCRLTDAGSKRVQITQQSAGIMREKWTKKQQLLWTDAAAANGIQMQQPTRSLVRYKNERMRSAGEEGNITSNTTINQSGCYCVFFVVLLVLLFLSVID